MKESKRLEAVRLRKLGHALNHISRQLRVAKSSVSLWVRDIPLTQVQKQKLLDNASKAAGAWSTHKAEMRRTKWSVEARNQFSTLSQNSDFLFGLGIYAGEGGKTVAASCDVTNSDPAVIRSAIRFFKVVGIHFDKIKLIVRSYPDLSITSVRDYWHNYTGLVPRVYITTPSVAGRGVCKKSKHGTARLCISSTELMFKVLFWLNMQQSCS